MKSAIGCASGDSAEGGGFEPEPGVAVGHAEVLVPFGRVDRSGGEPPGARLELLEAYRFRRRGGGLEAVAPGEVEMDEARLRAPGGPRIRCGSVLPLQPVTMVHGSPADGKRERARSLCHRMLAKAEQVMDPISGA